MGSVELRKEGTTLKVSCERRRGYDWHVRPLIAACCLSLDEDPDFFVGVADVVIILEDGNPYDEIEGGLVFPKTIRRAEGPRCIPRAPVLEARARAISAAREDTEEDYERAYDAVLELLCEPEESVDDDSSQM
jgi:hypothetical protein